MASSALRLVPPPPTKPPAKTPNDRPVSWDGHPVVWDEWRHQHVGTIFLHAKLDALACTACGVLNPVEWRCTGARAVLPSITHEQIATTYRAGKGGQYALRTLALTRCSDCGHDQVYDFDADELWDLDETDYGPAGSVDPATLQGELW